jgi:hypothetical protein
MRCRVLPLTGGGVAIVCGPFHHRQQRRCCVCHVPETLATLKLCDGPPLRGRGTCDQPVCVDHAVHVEPDIDYCPRHAPGRG